MPCHVLDWWSNYSLGWLVWCFVDEKVAVPFIVEVASAVVCLTLVTRCMPSVRIFEGAQRILKHSLLKMLQLHKPGHHFIFAYFWIMGTCKTVDLGWFWLLFYIPRRDHRRLDWTLAKFSSVESWGFVPLLETFNAAKVSWIDFLKETCLPIGLEHGKDPRYLAGWHMNSECIDHHMIDSLVT